MARMISHTLILEGQLVAATPLHLGGADTGHETDLPLAVDGKGRFYLPGTSLAGAIRAWEHAQDSDTVWGYASGDKGHASYVLVDDAPAVDAPLAELWHGIGIDRRHGGTARRAKFDRQVLPKGTRFDFRLLRELADSGELPAGRLRMGRILLALESGDIAFGGGVSRGFGRLTLERARASETCWNSRSGIIAWLGGATTDALAEWQAVAGRDPQPRDHLLIEIHWQALGPLMSKAARDGLAVDIVPFVSRTGDGNQSLTLPGSAIKGALRSHAERIVRTVLGRDENADAEQHFDQIDVCLVRDLFGSARPADLARKNVPPPVAARSLVSVDTCYASQGFAEEELAAFDQARDDWRNTAKLARAEHVAIDRWTGGTAEGMLYNAIEPGQIQWQPIHLRFDRGRSAAPAALALLWLTLRDFCAGRIPLGFGVNRGYGELAVSQVEVTDYREGGKKQTLPVLNGVMNEDAITPLVEKMRTEWGHWLKSKEQAQ